MVSVVRTGEHGMQGPSDFEITRRDLLKAGAVSVAVSAVPLAAKGQTPESKRSSGGMHIK
jgi:hypothetical protein